MRSPNHTPSNISTEIGSSGANQQTLYEVLWSMKNLISVNPEQAKHILANNPMFAVSILRALHTLEIIDDNALQSLITPPTRDPRQNTPAPPFPTPQGNTIE